MSSSHDLLKAQIVGAAATDRVHRSISVHAQLLRDLHQEEEARARRASRPVLGEDAQSESQAPVEPGWLEDEPVFPELADALDTHQWAMSHYGQSAYPLRDQGALESALAAPQNHYWGMFGAVPEDASPDPYERLLEGAAKMGYGIGESQPFLNGNKRTARLLMQQFLHSNELGHVMPLDHDDEELADHLTGYGIRMCPTDGAQLDENGQCPTCGRIPSDGGVARHTLQNTMDMFKQRHRNGGPDTTYSPYPDDEATF